MKSSKKVIVSLLVFVIAVSVLSVFNIIKNDKPIISVSRISFIDGLFMTNDLEEITVAIPVEDTGTSSSTVMEAKKDKEIQYFLVQWVPQYILVL